MTAAVNILVQIISIKTGIDQLEHKLNKIAYVHPLFNQYNAINWYGSTICELVTEYSIAFFYSASVLDKPKHIAISIICGTFLNSYMITR